MRVASVNANKGLGTPSRAGAFLAWLDRVGADVAVAQEPWKGQRAAAPVLRGWQLVAGDEHLAAWVRRGSPPVHAERPEPWWMTVKLGTWSLHSVHLDAYSSAARCAQLVRMAAVLEADSHHLAVGDFNLAPRPDDGRFGDEPSGFTSAAERDALTRLLGIAGWVDGTAAREPEFTFERQVRGRSSRFRCDLALAPPGTPVRAEHGSRIGPGAFTDHSGLVADLEQSWDRSPRPDVGHQPSLFDEPSAPPASPPAVSDEGAALTQGSYKTAMHRSRPSGPAARLAELVDRWCADLVVDASGGDVLDYGCGVGADVAFHRSRGLTAAGWDPHPPFGFQERPIGTFRVVTVMYVLNVLPVAERAAVLAGATEHLAPGGRLVVATRSAQAIDEAAAKGGWRRWDDGYVSHEARSTFQHGFEPSELVALGRSVGLEAVDEELPRVPGAAVVVFSTRS